MNTFNNEYIIGDKISSAYTFKPPINKYTTRIHYLKEMLKGQRIIHVGFADHIELINKKIKLGRWAHKEITDVTEKCIGIDINHEAVSYVKNNLKINNVFYYDILSIEKLKIIDEENWDYILLGEILEHTYNPLDFIKKIHNKYNNIEKIVITVPNAFNIMNFKNARKHYEKINSDHKYQFSPYTISKILILSGFSIESINFVDYFKWSFFAAIRRPVEYLQRIIFPFLRDNIVIVAKF